MLSLYRRCIALVGRDQRLRWVLMVVLAVAVSGLEAVGAVLIYLLLGLATGNEGALDLPLLGDVRAWLPGMGDRRLLLALVVCIAAFFLARAAILIGQTYAQHRLAENAGARLSERLLRAYQHQPYAAHLQRSSSELIRNAHDSVSVVMREAVLATVVLVSESFIVLALLTLLLLASPLATVLAVAAFTPLVMLLMGVIHPKVKEYGKASQAVKRSGLQALQQALDGWREIHVLGRERFFREHFATQRRELAKARYRKATAQRIPRVAIETVLVLSVGGYLSLHVLSEGSALGAVPLLGLFGYAVLRIQPSLNNIFTSLNHVKFAEPAVNDLYEDLCRAEQLALPRAEDDDGTALPLREQLTVEDLTYCYDGSSVPALRDINLVLPAGESLGIVGPTGSGKSTLVNLILGLLEPTKGRITVDGIDIEGRAPAWHRSLGVVPQSIYLIDDTLRRNIALGVPDRDIDERRVQEAIMSAQLSEFVASLPQGLETVVGERGVRVSGGERQRVAIARALYPDPAVLVFDEGTSAMDTVTEAEFMRTLEGLRRRRTLILVAHRLSTVRPCDRIAFLHQGTLLDVASFDVLEARNPFFRALVHGGGPT